LTTQQGNNTMGMLKARIKDTKKSNQNEVARLKKLIKDSKKSK